MTLSSAEQLAIYRKQLEVFVQFTDEEWTIFASKLYLRSIKKKELFISSGRISNEIGFIVSGSFRFFYVKDGIEISGYFCFGLDLIASYKSFLTREPGLVNIEALEDSLVICFSHATLQQLTADDRIAYKMGRFGRLVAEYLICCYEDRVISFVTKSPEERYLHLLRNQPDLIDRIPQHYIANFLGITPVSLSRIRKRISTPARGQLKKVRA